MTAFWILVAIVFAIALIAVAVDVLITKYEVKQAEKDIAWRKHVSQTLNIVK